MPTTTMLLLGSNPSSTGTTASSEAGDPIRIRRSAAVPASAATPASRPLLGWARRSPRRGADALRRDFPFRPDGLRAGGFLAGGFLADGLACVIVAWAGVVSAWAGAAGVGLACDVLGVLVIGASVEGVLAGGVLAGAPGTGCGDEVPAERSGVIEPSVGAVNAAGEFDLLAVDNSGEIPSATKVFLDGNRRRRYRRSTTVAIQGPGTPALGVTVPVT
jgi:hypothetical protein